MGPDRQPEDGCGPGPTAVLNRSYEVFARTCGCETDPCRPAMGSDKGKAERGVPTLRSAFGKVLCSLYPRMAEPFDVVVPRRVSRDRPISFEGQTLSACRPSRTGSAPPASCSTT